MPAFVHEATYTFSYESTSDATRIELSLRPELGEIDERRSTVSLTRDDETLEISVEATDLVALRAASNTWLTLVDVAETISNTGNRFVTV